MSLREFYDQMYRDNTEPWNYSFRAAELLRHEKIVDTIRGLAPKNFRALDIGCSVGQLTALLAAHSMNVWGADISKVAIDRIKARYSGNPPFHLLVADSTQIPLEDSFFDVAVLADGMAEWKLSETEVRQKMREIHRLLKPGSAAIFTDYLRPGEFKNWAALISGGPLKIIRVIYLNDRLWYQFESVFKAIKHWKWVRGLLRSKALAKCLQVPARFFGSYGSRHLMIIALKSSSGIDTIRKIS